MQVLSIIIFVIIVCLDLFVVIMVAVNAASVNKILYARVDTGFSKGVCGWVGGGGVWSGKGEFKRPSELKIGLKF